MFTQNMFSFWMSGNGGMENCLLLLQGNHYPREDKDREKRWKVKELYVIISILSSYIDYNSLNSQFSWLLVVIFS